MLELNLKVAASFTTAVFADVWRAWSGQVRGIRVHAEHLPHGEVEACFARGDLGRGNRTRRDNYLEAVFLNPDDFASRELFDSVLRRAVAAAAQHPGTTLIVITPARDCADDPPGPVRCPGVDVIGPQDLLGMYEVPFLAANPAGTWRARRRLFSAAPVYRATGVPYHPSFYALLAAAAVRRAVGGWLRDRRKIVYLDCDHTLWRGVASEVAGDALGVAPFARLQRRVKSLRDSGGVLLGILSKNDEPDVARIFADHPGMQLSTADFAAARVNWEPKPGNLLASLAEDVQLQPQNAVFVDDNPAEVDRMRRSVPDVLSILVTDATRAAFTRHHWVLDVWPGSLTAEDARRPAVYGANAQRRQAEKAAGGLAAFMASLGLVVHCQELPKTSGAATAEDTAVFSRMAQLTMRTNQFNTNGSEGYRMQVAGLEAYLALPRNHAFAVSVRDKYGDYGVVGGVLWSLGGAGRAAVVELLAMSCRVLNRGVEHEMLRFAARAAARRSGDDGVRVVFPLRVSDRNKLAQAFHSDVSCWARSCDPKPDLLLPDRDTKTSTCAEASVSDRATQEASSEDSVARDRTTVVEDRTATTSSFCTDNPPLAEDRSTKTPPACIETSLDVSASLLASLRWQDTYKEGEDEPLPETHLPEPGKQASEPTLASVGDCLELIARLGDLPPGCVDDSTDESRPAGGGTRRIVLDCVGAVLGGEDGPALALESVTAERLSHLGVDSLRAVRLLQLLADRLPDVGGLASGEVLFTDPTIDDVIRHVDGWSPEPAPRPRGAEDAGITAAVLAAIRSTLPAAAAVDPDTPLADLPGVDTMTLAETMAAIRHRVESRAPRRAVSVPPGWCSMAAASFLTPRLVAIGLAEAVRAAALPAAGDRDPDARRAALKKCVRRGTKVLGFKPKADVPLKDLVRQAREADSRGTRPTDATVKTLAEAVVEKGSPVPCGAGDLTLREISAWGEADTNGPAQRETAAALDASTPGNVLSAARVGDVQFLEENYPSAPALRTVLARSRDRHGLDAVSWAAGGGHLGLLRHVFGRVPDLAPDAPAKDGRTPFMWACRNGRLATARYLVARGADPRARTKKGVTALHWAVWGGSVPVADWLLDGLGHRLGDANNAGCNGAVWAATNGSLALCRWALGRGGDFSRLNDWGHGAVVKAAWRANVPLLEWLFRCAGVPAAHLFYEDVDGRIPLDLAERREHGPTAAWLRRKMGETPHLARCAAPGIKRGAGAAEY
ncbi:putative ZDHHC-type palmitoyltransferase 6 [Diplonema papillatum]|nr:putative ZDHHC-type palmitoyltransferase 6 [Diplonema papillatum]